MQFDFHTKVSGEFEIFRHNNDGSLVSVSTAKNLITNYGLADVKNTFWASCFTKLVVGTGTTPPQVTDTVLERFMLGTSLYAASPASSSIVTSNQVVMTRAFLLTNNTDTGFSIRELGTTRAATLNSSSRLFSRAVITPGITIAPGETITVLYRLTLSIPGNTFSSFSFVNASAPTNSAGIISRPLCVVNANGTNETNTTFPKAEARVFEPYLMRTQGYYGWVSGNISSGFSNARTFYLNNPSLDSNNVDVVSALNGQGSTTTVDVGNYAQQTYFIISPGSTTTLGGFAFYGRSVSGSSTARNTGLWCAFNSLYTVPTSHYVKISFNQSWSRA